MLAVGAGGPLGVPGPLLGVLFGPHPAGRWRTPSGSSAPLPMCTPALQGTTIVLLGHVA